MKTDIRRAYARYSASVDDLLRALEPFGDEQLNATPRDGGWSAMQVLHHLIMVEENSMAYIRKKLGFQPKLERAGLKASVLSALLWISFYIPIKFKAPPSASPERIPDQAGFSETRKRWEEIRAAWKTFFDQMPEDLADKAAYRHPRIGLINWLQMIAFFKGHFERHKRQIKRALR